MRNSSSENLKHKFRSLHIKLKKITCNHFKQLISEQQENPKIFWKYLKSLKKSLNKILSLLNSNGDVITENTEIVNALNFQFLSFYQRRHNPSTSGWFIIWGDYEWCKYLPCWGSKTIRNPDPMHKSLDPDNIPPRIVKELAAVLSPFLSNLFQQSIDLCELPIDCKLANVCPIYKSGCTKNPGNYHPVSLTSIVSKTLGI